MKAKVRVRFLGCDEPQQNWGGPYADHSNLEVGKEYILEDFVVHSWHTKIYLEGFTGAFNSVCFEGVNFDLDSSLPIGGECDRIV